ncbi:MAG: glycosyltransferase [Bacteroidia bacterium]
MANAFKKKGYEPRLRSIQASSYNDFALNPKSGSWDSISFKYLHSSQYKQFKPARWFNKFLALLKGAIELQKNRSQVALIYFYNPRYTDSMALMKYSKNLKLPLVVDQTELFSTIDSRSLKDEEYIASHADVLLVISNKLKAHFQSKYSMNTVFQVPIAVDLGRFTEPSEDLNYTIGYLGSFASKDGITDILSAYTKAKQVYPQLKLRLIGHNAGMNGNSMNSTDDIVFTGAVDAKDIPAELAQCDTFILNRLNNAFSSYGFPYKLGEYFAAGSPVLVSDIDGFSQELPDHVVLKYRAGDVKALIRAILYRYENLNEMNDLARKGYQYAEKNYNSNVVENSFVSSFTNALK